ncbi:hypothetical protein PG994_000394 [Apiospora phragmitis]|uniref:Uncharacterized protein n=1 Tax=Apiospora phragmitis TaxID=2905665 RepID=A0ABR1X6B7_9PEZI
MATRQAPHAVGWNGAMFFSLSVPQSTAFRDGDSVDGWGLEGSGGHEEGGSEERGCLSRDPFVIRTSLILGQGRSQTLPLQRIPSVVHCASGNGVPIELEGGFLSETKCQMRGSELNPSSTLVSMHLPETVNTLSAMVVLDSWVLQAG